MSDISTFNPNSLNEALTLLAQAPEETVVLAGGTDLQVRLKNRQICPTRIIHIGFIPELSGLQETDHEIQIGALTTHSELLRFQGQGTWCKLLASAAAEIGSVQIRNRGTIGGNLINASPAADLLPVLAVLEARLVLNSVNGCREVPIDEFFTGPGQTVRQPDEILTQVVLPQPAATETGRFIKLGQRRALAISKTMLALCCEIRQDKLHNPRIALGAVAPTVVRCPRTEALLTDQRLTDELIARASSLVQDEVAPISDLRSTADYRREMCGVLLTQVLESAGQNNN